MEVALQMMIPPTRNAETRPRAAGSATLLAAVLATLGCSPQSPPEFPSVHQGARVFVSHTPIWPQADDPVRILARAEPVDAGPGSLKVRAFTSSNAQPILTRECRFETPSAEVDCELAFDQPAVENIVYEAEMDFDSGETVRSGLFTYDTRPGSIVDDRLHVLRAPFHRRAAAFKVVLIRACGARLPQQTTGIDCHTQYGDAAFLDDVETAINDQVHRDPALRWRSQQLAWHVYSRAGQVASVDSGLTARCGGDPWPSERQDVRLPELVRDADVIGSVHRQGGGDESFRDCAARHVAAPDIATFSASGFSPQIFQHEFGHALFGLGDEYPEDASTRAFPEGQTPGPDLCTCCNFNDGCADGATPCSVPQPATCFVAGPWCPGLAGDCGNLFLTEAECQSFAARLDSRPWLESRAGGCEQLCGEGTDTTCPCDGTPALWIFDRRNPPPGDSDVMGTSEGGPAETGDSRFGPACAACVEATFCRRWTTTVQGLSEEEAQIFCDDRLQ